MRATEPIRLAVLHDSEIVLAGMTTMLAPYAERVAVVPTPRHHPAPVDVALSDLCVRPVDVAGELAHLRRMSGAPRIVVYSWQSPPALVDAAFAKGASGYLSMALPAPDLVTALEEVVAGNTFVGPRRLRRVRTPLPAGAWLGQEAGLSERESEIVGLITLGLSNRELAERAFLSVNTVKTYIRSAYRKMDVTGRSTAVLWAIDHGFHDER